MNFQEGFFCNEYDLKELENLLQLDSTTHQPNKKETNKRCLNDISSTFNIASSTSKKQRTLINSPDFCEQVIYYADSIERRNARERNRVRQVNQGFENLQRVTRNETNYNNNSNSGEKKRVSKLNILKRAIDRIQHLTNILYEDDLRQSGIHCSSMPKFNNENATTRIPFNYNKETAMSYYYPSECCSELIYNVEKSNAI